MDPPPGRTGADDVDAGAGRALVAVREAVGTEPTALLDSGIRSGADVVKAMACGADAVTLGRPHLYGLAIDGRRGVGAVLGTVLADVAALGAAAWLEHRPDAAPVAQRRRAGTTPWRSTRRGVESSCSAAGKPTT